MSRDIIIGEPKGRTICSAITVFELDKCRHRVSQNSEAYWIHNGFLGLELIIYKDTDEGKSLAAYITNGVNHKSIDDWLDDLALDRCPKRLLKEKIAIALHGAKELGSETRAAEIRHALGIGDSRWDA